MDPLLVIRDLKVRFEKSGAQVNAVNGIDLAIETGEKIAIVGESGCGKSQTMMAALGILSDNGTASGEIIFQDKDLLQLNEKKLNKIRGRDIAMIFQDPMTALTPNAKIADQMNEVLNVHLGLSQNDATQRSIDMLNLVQIPDAKTRMRQYPHELSGGMRQRVMIAMALQCNPKILIADEPTTALDVTIQAEIIDLFNDINKEFGMAIILITHDLGLVAGFAERVLAMYCGRIIESGSVDQLFYSPSHPYTKALLNSIPNLEKNDRSPLQTIPGQPPVLSSIPEGCSFQARCHYAFDKCRETRPDLHPTNDHKGHLNACFLNQT